MGVKGRINETDRRFAGSDPLLVDSQQDGGEGRSTRARPTD